MTVDIKNSAFVPCVMSREAYLAGKAKLHAIWGDEPKQFSPHCPACKGHGLNSKGQECDCMDVYLNGDSA